MGRRLFERGDDQGPGTAVSEVRSTARPPAAADPLRAWLETFESVDRERSAREPGWLVARRRAAAKALEAQGFPTTRDEEWRFTNPAPVTRTAFSPALRARPQAAAIDALDLGDAGALRLVFVNGRLEEAFSRFPDPATRVVAGSLGTAILRSREGTEGARIEAALGRHARAEGSPFSALNEALFADGAYVHVPHETCLPVPLHLVFLTSGADQPTACHPRSLVLLESGSRATIVETHADLGGGPVLTNAVTEVVLGPNSHLERARVQQHSDEALHVSTTHVHQGRDSAFASLDVSVGARFARNDLDVLLSGEGGSCSLDGLYLASGRQVVDHHTRIDHAVPRCSSRELYKGILDGQAAAVFSGRILVREGAMKTDARQANHNLLLSEDAVVDTKPMLEIYADDVKCAHGATVGQLDEAALFYLRSRGLSPAAARSILVRAFAAEVVRREATPALEARLARLLSSRLPAEAS
jgi:Fe-S cluster assembly protein SufD